MDPVLDEVGAEGVQPPGEGALFIGPIGRLQAISQMHCGAANPQFVPKASFDEPFEGVGAAFHEHGPDVPLVKGLQHGGNGPFSGGRQTVHGR